MLWGEAFAYGAQRRHPSRPLRLRPGYGDAVR